MRERLFHLVRPTEWAASAPGESYAPPSLAAEGFVHLSTAAQVAQSAERHFADASELLVLSFERASLEPALRFEEAHGQLFPHYYGAIDKRSVVQIEELRRDASGRFHWR